MACRNAASRYAKSNCIAHFRGELNSLRSNKARPYPKFRQQSLICCAKSLTFLQSMPCKDLSCNTCGRFWFYLQKRMPFDRMTQTRGGKRVTGVPRGLQNRCAGHKPADGFDSHVPPPQHPVVAYGKLDKKVSSKIEQTARVREDSGILIVYCRTSIF